MYKYHCSSCKQVGHSMATCPVIEPRALSPRRCSKCLEAGHTIKRCPMLSLEQKTRSTSFTAAPFPDHLYFINAVRGVLKKDPIKWEGRVVGIQRRPVETPMRVYSEHEQSWK